MFFPITRLIIFHIIFWLIIGSLRLTLVTSPGNIPLYWGFHIGDDNLKKKRYCLICQVFKPERTHHCSICNICILNMDHHCPWINTCIGFYNRKFFIQLLVYTLIMTIYLSLVYIPFTYDVCVLLYQKRHTYDILLIGRCFLIIFNNILMMVMIYMVGQFVKFHLDLVCSNRTTIEMLDEELMKNNKYDINRRENWEQVFGIEPLYWFLPISTEKGYPKGDGLVWLNKNNIQKNNKSIDNNSNNIGVSSKGNSTNNKERKNCFSSRFQTTASNLELPINVPQEGRKNSKGVEMINVGTY